ncbi:MAG: PAS domain S-box protein [Nitrospiraceae bacterium]|nr:MAG: PAS domain S-box protein [Nitrospiraceae bacterium]
MSRELFNRVRALIYIRVIMVTLLLGSFYIFRVGYDRLFYPAAFSFLIISLYLLSIFYALLLRWIKDHSRFFIFAYVQIVVDVVAEVFLIYITGGIGSMFSFLFPLSILSAGIVLNRRDCYIIATLSSILYGLLLDLQYYRIIISTVSFYSEKDFFYSIFAHFTAFYLVAFLSGYLSDKLHKATQSLKERDTVLSDLKAFSKYIIESMPSGVFTTDLNRRIITFNSSAQEITQLSLEQVAGKFPEEIFLFLRNSGEPADRIEGEMQRNGELFPVGMRISALKDGAGRPIGIIGVFQDLTELKAMEAEVKRKEKWAFIGELSASIAHELRNPLASLKASVEMLSEKKVSVEYADRLMKIALSEMDRLNGIITDFLLYARPQKPDREPFDLHQSLRDVVMLLQGSESGKENVTITAKSEGRLMITGDAKQMQQVFWNLGINAVDAVSEGGRVDIYTARKGNKVEIVFRDTGTGINMSDMDKIFYPFFTTKEKGTGLGLSIARKIIEEHGGKIMVESGGPGNGTTFRVILPFNNEQRTINNE